MSQKTYYTRAEYMRDAQQEGRGPSKAHRRYFGQFVTPGTKYRVLSVIGLERLMASTDEHFNDIPLSAWDGMVPLLPGSGSFEKAGDYYTLANGVCLAKEAARQIVEAAKTKAAATEIATDESRSYGPHHQTNQEKQQ